MSSMPFFVVRRDLPGVTTEVLQSAGIRAKSCCAEMTGEGQPVRWVRSFYLPETAQTHCYFEAESKSTVEEGNQRAHIPFTQIVEVIEMTPEMV
jgi:hypothetical protein